MPLNSPLRVTKRTIQQFTNSPIHQFLFLVSLSSNAAGNRAFFGGDNKGHIIDFSDDTHVEYATNTAFCSATTLDRNYVYSANFKAAVFDFETTRICMKSIP